MRCRFRNELWDGIHVDEVIRNVGYTADDNNIRDDDVDDGNFSAVHLIVQYSMCRECSPLLPIGSHVAEPGCP